MKKELQDTVQEVKIRKAPSFDGYSVQCLEIGEVSIIERRLDYQNCLLTATVRLASVVPLPQY